MAGYVDLFLLPLPKKNMAAYKRLARAFGKLSREFGALEYREFVGDDLDHKKVVVSFTKGVKVLPGEVLIASIISYKSRKQRDAIMKKMMADPRMKKMMTKKPLFNAKKMVYGGFSTIVNV